MIVKVAKRGREAGGLLRYLYGPGKTNEHTNQHMVAGYGALPQLYTGGLSNRTATDLGVVLEGSWRESFRERLAVAGASVSGINSHHRATGGSDVLDAAEKPHVYHVIASNPPGVTFTDEQWAKVSQEIAEGMGFTTGPGDLNGAQWVSVRHGLSENGSDHVHLVFSMVRADGHRIDMPFRDYDLAQEVRHTIEDKYDFVQPLHDRDRPVNAGLSLPAYTQKEAADARRFATDGRTTVPDRVALQRVVRAAAATAHTEVEFIHAVAEHVEVEVARWAPGAQDVAVGYRVRVDEQGRWFTSSQLAPDLSLQKLRPAWAPNETPESRAQAAGLWREETPLTEPMTPASAPAELDRTRDYLAAWNADLAHLDRLDPAAWKREVVHAAGFASAVATSPVTFNGNLGPVADQLTRFALPGRDNTFQPVQTTTPATGAPDAAVASPAGDVDLSSVLGAPGRPTRPASTVPAVPAASIPAGPSKGELAARQVMLALRAADADSTRGWWAVMQQFTRVIGAVQDAQVARGELVAARATTALLTRELDAAVATVGRTESAIAHAEQRRLNPLAADPWRSLNMGSPSGECITSDPGQGQRYGTPRHTPNRPADPGIGRGRSL